jgi:hypothetical protein
MSKIFNREKREQRESLNSFKKQSFFFVWFALFAVLLLLRFFNHERVVFFYYSFSWNKARGAFTDEGGRRHLPGSL